MHLLRQFSWSGAQAFALACVCASACASGAAHESAMETIVRLASSEPRLRELVAARDDAFQRDASDAALVSESWRSARGSSGELGARLPERASEAMDLGPPRYEGTRLRVTLQGAGASPVTLSQGRAVYLDVFTDTDRVFASNASTLEEMLVLRSPRAPRAFAWHVDLPAGLPQVTTEDGGVTFRDVSGQAKIRVAAPFALDAQERKRELVLAWDAPTSTMRATLDTANLAFPIVLDPRYDAVAWSAVPLLTSRTAAMAYDAARGEVVLFGGTSPNTPSQNDTWTWNGAKWSKRSPLTSPGAREEAAMVYDARRREVLLFGGYNRNDTWRWDGVTWSEAPTTVRPDVGGPAGMAYDPVRDETILFTTTNTGLSPATWRWSGTAWSMLSPSSSPPFAYNSALAFDEARGNMILFMQSGATWRWNGVTWALLSPAQRPTARSGHTMVYDPVRAELVLFGGELPAGSTSRTNETWSWNGVTWRLNAPATRPAPRKRHGAAFDISRGEMIVFGGSDQQPVGVNAVAMKNDTWAWNGTTWREPVPPQAPPPREMHSTAYDARRSRGVVFGGQEAVLTPRKNDTWLWDGASWQQALPALSPPAQLSAAMAYDAKREEIVLFGDNAETWRWNGTTWSLANPALRPPPRYVSAMAYDAAREQILLFGGTTGGLAGGLNDTWLWNGTTWRDAAAPARPPARSGHAIGYDEARREVVVYGGYGTSSQLLGDTWRWDGTTWTNANPVQSPPPTADASMVYHAARGELLLHGGYMPALTNNTWRWNGVTWALGTAVQPPSARAHTGLFYDPTRSEVVLFGGGGNETWRFYYLGGTCSTNSECPGSTCVDGVCCQVPSCGTCETCAGFAPGTCTPVLNHEDSDTCSAASGHACSDTGECKLARGSAATRPQDCASAIVVDGVCCESACDGVCQACRADLKESGTNSGVCDFARSGTDARNQCQEEGPCKSDGTCDGRGACRPHVSGVACGPVVCVDNRATGRICDGLGVCGDSAQGVACDAYACSANTGCPVRCSANSDCAALHHCESERCVADRGAACDGDHIVTSPDGSKKDCAPFRCEGAACRTACVNVNDCVFPAQCTADGRCVTGSVPVPIDAGGCNCGVTHASSDQGGGAVAIAIAAATALMVRRKRRRT